jgi:pilus assembly protein CpaF
VKGFTTIHAGSARQALTRLRFVAQLSDASSQIPLAALNSLVSESIDLVVHCQRTAAGPQVTEVIAVEDLAGGLEAAQFTVTQLFQRPGPTSELQWSGNLAIRAERALSAAGFDQRQLLSDDSTQSGARW